MQTTANQPDLKHLVLLGGGHAQISVLKSLIMNPIEGLRITLVSRDVMTPYSGMLPGYLEGQYHEDDITIDLSHLARLAGARFIHAAAESIDPDAKMIMIKDRPPLSYDVLSINIGSNPDPDAIKGARKYAVAVKPISTLLKRIEPVLSNENMVGNLTIIGGGAAGVEVALSLHHFMQSQLRDISIRLVHRGSRIMPEFPERAAELLMQEMNDKDIEVITGVAAAEIRENDVLLEDGRVLTSDQTLVITAGKAPAFLGNTGISLDENGFIATRNTLQALSHDDIFASGDIGTVQTHPRPKAGVYAVRAGAVLAKNLRSHLLGKSLEAWFPQKNYLALIGVGGGRAMPIRGHLALPPSRWAWTLKNWIDTKFIKKFSDLPEMDAPPPSALAKTMAESDQRDDPALLAMRCLGCGAKTGWSDLNQALQRAEDYVSRHLGADLSTPSLDVTSDSAELMLDDIKANHKMVQSVDAISAIVDDPFLLGRIAALHALSDIYASCAKPHHALAVLTLPSAMADLQKDDITQLLAGAMCAFHENGAYLAGGHTAQANDLQVGFAVTGFAKNTAFYAPRDGDAIILTKPLGIGLIMAAHRQGHPLATGALRQAAIDVMSQSNGIAANCLEKFGAFPMTDVTGFGLVRHGYSLLSSIGDGLGSAEIMTSALPVIEGAEALAEDGMGSSILSKNMASAQIESDHQAPTSLLYDPQTGGGLMAIVPHDKVQDIIASLIDCGHHAAHIGWFRQDGEALIRIKETW